MKRKIKYSDEPIGKLKIIKNFLPSPEDITFKEEPNSLSRQRCLACEGGARPLNVKEAKGYLKVLPGWRLARGGKEIEIEYKMKNFMAAIGMIQKIAGTAEKENHHPDLHLTGYRRLKVTLSTHAIHGLSLNDFILAAKVQKLVVSFKTIIEDNKGQPKDNL